MVRIRIQWISGTGGSSQNCIKKGKINEFHLWGTSVVQWLLPDPACPWQVFGKKNLNSILISIKNLGLDLDPDWIRIQQQPGSGSGFIKCLDLNSLIQDPEKFSSPIGSILSNSQIILLFLKFWMTIQFCALESGWETLNPNRVQDQHMEHLTRRILAVLRIRDVYPGSLIRIFSIPDPRQRILVL